MGKLIDLTGQRFGRLVVIGRGENKGRFTCWNCKCDCGNEKVIRATDLKSGKTQSCGCLHRGKMKDVNEKQKQDEELRLVRSNNMKKMVEEKWQDEEFRQMKSDKMKQLWQDEEFRQMQKDIQGKITKQRWQDEGMKWKFNYKGGISPITNHLRAKNEEWFSKCKKEANYTCQLTGKRGGIKLNTHHLYAFSSIVIDAHNTYNIEVKPQVKDYTEEELKLLEEYVAEWHKDSSNAVVLSEEAHKLFHSLYGKGDNTPEQYEEFKQRYLSGEFEELI